MTIIARHAAKHFFRQGVAARHGFRPAASAAISAVTSVGPCGKPLCSCNCSCKSSSATTSARFLSTSSNMDDLKSGTAAYMDLYPETSTDGALRLGNIVPDFKAETTQGTWESFHEWKKGKWAILFSHPADFTPVCTTEIGRLALKYDHLQELGCLVATLSVDPVKSHEDWLKDVVAHCENKIEVSEKNK